VGSGSGYISVWYDQSGNSKDAIQATTASQPRIVNAGVVDVNKQGLPGVVTKQGTYIDDGGTSTNSPSGNNRYGITGSRTLTVVAQPKVYTNGGTTDGSGTYVVDRNQSSAYTTPLTSIKIVSDKWDLQSRDDASSFSGSIQGNTTTVSTTRADNITMVNSGDTYTLEVNGIWNGTQSNSTSSTMAPVRIGYGSSSSEEVLVQEVLLFPSALSTANRLAVYNSQSTSFSLGLQVWTGATSTDWNTASNWANNQVPDASSNVVVPSSTTYGLVITSSQTTLVARKITINSGAVVTINGNVSITDSLTANGTIDGTGTVTLNGSSYSQYVRGTICGLTISNTNTTYASGALDVNGALTLASGAVLNMGAYPLGGTLTSISIPNGEIQTANISANPIPSGKTWGSACWLTFNATTGNQTIPALSTTHLKLANTSGTQTASGNIAVDQILTVPSGTTLNMGTYTLSGTLSSPGVSGTLKTANTTSTPIPTGKTWGGTINYSATTGNQTIVSATSYNNLTLSNTSSTQTAGANIVVNGTLTTTAGGTFNLGTNTLTGTLATITNDGTISISNTTSAPIASGKIWGGTGTVKYAVTTGAQTIIAGTYNNLQLSNTSGTNTATGSIALTGTLTVPLSGTLDLATYQLTGSSGTISNSGTIKTANTTNPPLPTGKTWGGTVQYYATTGTQTVADGTYNNLTVSNTSGTQTASGNLVVNGILTTTANGILSLSTYTLSGTLGTITNNGTIATANTSSAPLPSSKTWGGTINYNATTGNQTVVAATAYNNLTLSNTSNTQTAGGNIVVNGALTNSTGTFDLSTYTLSGSLTSISNSGTISTANTSSTPIPTGKTWNGTISYNAATGGQTIVSATSYTNLTTGNTSNMQTSGANLVVNGTLTTTAGGTLSLGTNTLSGTLSAIANNGTISTANLSGTPIPTGKTWGGTINYNAATGNQTIVSATAYNNLTLSNTSGIQTAGANLVVNGTLTTTAGGTLNLATNTLSGTLSSVTNNGTITTSNTTATPLASGVIWGGTGTVQYAVSTGGQTVVSGTYYNLTLSNTSNTNTATGNIGLNGTLTTQSGGTFDLATYQFTGSSGTISNSGTIKTANTTNPPLPTGKTWGGTVQYYATTGTQTVVDGTYNNLILNNTSGTQTAGGNLVVNGALSIASGGTLSLGVNTLSGTLSSVANSGTITTANISQAPLPSGKTWGGTVTYNATTGGQYVANGTYTNLSIANTAGECVVETDNLSVTGTLIIGAGATLNFGSHPQTALSGTISMSSTGTISTSNTGSTPLPAGRTWDGTVVYYASSGLQTVVTGTYNNLTISNTSGTQTANGDLVVNGTLTTGIGSILDLGVYTLSGALAWVSNNGTISTANTGPAPLPSGKTWNGMVRYNASTGGQRIVDAISYIYLTLDNSSGTQTAGGDITVYGALTTATGGTFDLGTNIISYVNVVANNGTITTSNSGTTPLPAGNTWGGTVHYALSTGGQTIASGTYNNLTLGNTSGTQSLTSTTTVNGALTMSGGKFALGSNTLKINGTLSGHSATSSFVANGSSTLNVTSSLVTTLYFDQTTPGVTNRLYTLNYNNAPATLTLGSPLQVATFLVPVSGTLATNDQLTLVSNATRTALISAGSGSYITGNVTVERYIPSVARRWRFMSSPVSGSTLADWQNEIYITGTGGTANGFDSTLSNTPGVYSYDETATGDLWVAPSTINTALATGKGFRVFIRGDRSDPGVLNGNTGTQAAVTMNVIGPVNKGDITIPITYTDTGTPASDGWNLVGNPYPSPISWNTFHDAGRTGTSPNYSGTDYAHLDAVISVYDVNTASYVSYNAVSNTGTGSLSNGIIPSGGAFWVTATAASPSMTMKEAYKSISTPAAMFKEAPSENFTLKLSKDAITSDEMIVKYIPDADKNFDVYDIAKRNGEVNVSSVTENVRLLTVNCKPFNGISDTIRLNIAVAQSGNYTMESRNMNLLSQTLGVYLVDAFTHTVIDLNANPVYTFAVDKNNTSSFGSGRFMIVVGEKPGTTTALEEIVPETRLALYPTVTQGSVTLSSSNLTNEPADIVITDISGHIVKTFDKLNWNGQKITLDLSGYSIGTYFISITSASATITFKCIKSNQ